MRRGSGNQTKEQITDSAVRLFAARGFAATTVQDIVDDAGVTKGAFYHHFQTKNDVLVHVYRNMETDFLARAQAVVDAGGSAREQISGIVSEVIVTLEKFRPHAAVQIGELRVMRDEEALGADQVNEVAALTGQTVELVMGVLDEGIRNGELREVGNRQAVAFSMLSLPVLVYGWLDRDTPVDRNTTGQMFADLFLQGIEITGGTPPAAKKAVAVRS